jgi:hypothetical protein
MDLFAIFLLVFDLSDVESKGFQSAGLKLVLCGDFVEAKTAETTLRQKHTFFLVQSHIF